jgi:hypothetical protein
MFRAKKKFGGKKMVHKIIHEPEYKKYVATLKKLRGEGAGKVVKIEVTARDITKVRGKFVLEEYDPEYEIINVELVE